MPGPKSDKKERILNAAYALFLEKGYTDTKIIEIADRAGIGKGTVYEYFDSKEALFLDLFHYLGTQYKDASRRFMGELSDPSPIARLKRALEFEQFVGRYIGEHNVSFSTIFFESSLLKSDVLMTMVEELMTYQIKVLMEIIQDGITAGCFRTVDPFLAATTISGGINYFMGAIHSPRKMRESILPFLCVNEETSSAEKLDEYLQFVLNGLAS